MRGPRVALRGTTSKVFFFFFFPGRTTGWSAIINIFRMQAGNGNGNGDNRMRNRYRNRAVMFIYVCANAPNNAQKIIIITISITIIMIMITIRYDVRKCVWPDNPLQIWIVSFRFVPHWSQGGFLFPSFLSFAVFVSLFLCPGAVTVFSSFHVCVAEHITRTLYSIANVAFIGALKW